MHVADKMGEYLGLGKEARRLVRLAGLLHDIGHGPFGHVSEEVFKAIGTKQQSDSNIYKFHENLTARIIKSKNSLASYLDDDAERIADLIDPMGKPSIEKEIVSSPYDADKMDYLLRDSYFCGVKYGVFDYDRLIMMLSPFEKKRVMVKYEGIPCFEQYVVAKYFINTQVYRHKIRLITDAMLKRGILLSIGENDYLKRLYAYHDSDEYLEEYLKSCDAEVIRLGSIGDSNGAKIFKFIQSRKLFKRVFQIRANQIDDKLISTGIMGQIENPDLEKISRVENNVARLFGVDPDFTILNIYRLGFTAGEAAEIGKVFVLIDDIPNLIQDYSTICRDYNQELSSVFIEIYLPLELETQDREDFCRSKRNEIKSYLNVFAS